MSRSSSGLTPVYIGDIEDPATYWITPERSLSDPNVATVIQLEQWLSQYCQYTPSDHQGVLAGSDVAVRKCVGSWVRGKVEHVVTTIHGNKASVFLVDWGERLRSVKVDDVRHLPKQLPRDLQQLAWKLILKDVFGPWEENVLDVAKELVKRSDGARIETAGLTNAGGNLQGDLYLCFPFDGDWKKSLAPSLQKLIEEYDTELVHLNQMLNDIVKRTLSPSGLSIAGPQKPAKNKVDCGGGDRSEKHSRKRKRMLANFHGGDETGDFSSQNRRSLEVEGQSKGNRKERGIEHRKTKTTMQNYLADNIENNDLDSHSAANDRSSYKMNGVGGVRSFGHPDTSTPLNSSAEKNPLAAKSGLGRASRLKEVFGSERVGRNKEYNGEAHVSDLSPIEQSAIFGVQESGSSSSVSDRCARRTSVIDSVGKVSRGEMSKSQQSSTFGTGSGGVKLMPGGMQIAKKKKTKYDRDETFDERVNSEESGRGLLENGVYRPSDRSGRSKEEINSNDHDNCAKKRLSSNFKPLQRNLRREENAFRADQDDKKKHSKFLLETGDEEMMNRTEKSIPNRDNSWEPPRYHLGNRASDDNSENWGEGSGANPIPPPTTFTPQLQNLVQPEERAVGGLALSDLASNVTSSSRLADSRFTQDGSKTTASYQSFTISQGTNTKGDASEDSESEEINSSQFFTPNTSLGTEIDLENDSPSLQLKPNTDSQVDDKGSFPKIPVPSILEDSPSRQAILPTTPTVVSKEADVDGRKDNLQILSMDPMSHRFPIVKPKEGNVDGVSEIHNRQIVPMEPMFPSGSPTPIVESMNADVDGFFKKDIRQLMSIDPRSQCGFPRSPIVKSKEADVDNVSKNYKLQILSMDPRSPSGFPRTPIVVEEKPELSQSENENIPRKSNEATVKDNQTNPLKTEMRMKLLDKIKKLKNSEELSLPRKDVPKIDESNKLIPEEKLSTNADTETPLHIQAPEKPEQREVTPECEKSDGEQFEQGEDPLENLIRNLNKTSINQPVKDKTEKVSLAMVSRKFHERFNSREAWTRLLMHRSPKSQGGRPCKLADHVTQLSWHGELIRFLRQQGVTYSTIIQSALWPAVTRLMSVVAIGGKGQGKTVGWALPLLSNLSDHDHYTALPPGQGPTVVVLAAGWKVVRDIAETLEDVCNKARLNVTVAAAYAGRETQLMATLINGVDVLVVTPSCLIRLINTYKFTDLERCCHFILEEGDRLLEWFPKEVESLIVSWKNVGLKFKGLPDQTIVVAERWSEAVKQFVVKYERDIGLIVLGSLLEGVVYGQLTTKSHFFMDSEEKLEKLLEIVVGRGSNRVCICCRDVGVGEELVQNLIEAGVEPLFVHENSEPGDRQDKMDDWRQYPRMPLVITDLALMFVIDPVPTDILVHWDLPRESKKEFGIRFLMLKPAMKSVYGESNPMPGEFRYEETSMDPENACVHLMLGREDCHMLRTIVQLLKRTGADIPPPLTSFYFGLKTCQAKEAVLSGESLCSQLASRGVCRDRKLDRCNQRHFLHNEMDQPTTAASGILSFLVLFVESPVRYWVRIQDPVLDRKYQSLVFKMGRHYSKESNIVMLTEEEMHIGQAVVSRYGDGVYRRGRVLSKLYDRTRTKHRLHKIHVFLLDEGHKELVDPGDLVQLPAELGVDEFPPSAAAVIVAGLMPQDRDSDWTISAEMFVSNKLNLHSDDHDIVCRGRILLAMGNTFWINKCQLMVRQANIGKYICAFETRDRLLDSNHAVDNPGHMEPLYQLAARAGIHKPEFQSISVATSEGALSLEEPRVAFLPLDDICQVYMSECFSPSLFYITNCGSVKSLNELERDMGLWAKEQGTVKAGWQPRPGDCIMVRREQQDPWQRGRVKEKLGTRIAGDDDHDDVWSWDNFKVVFVDTGETETICLTDLAPIHQKFIKRLPFQAVKCSLAFVKPETRSEFVPGQAEPNIEIVETVPNESVKDDKMNEIEVENDPENDKWVGDAGDTLYELTRDLETDEAEVLWCDVFSMKGEGPQRHYTVRLSSQTTDLATALVNDGLAEYHSNELLVVPPPPPEIQPDVAGEDPSQEENEMESHKGEQISPMSLNPEDYDVSMGIEKNSPMSINPEDYDVSMGILDDVANKACDNYVEERLDPNYQEKQESPISSDDETNQQLQNLSKNIDEQHKKVKDSVSSNPLFVPPAPLHVSARPPDMPAATPVLDLSPVEMKKPGVVWSQDQNSIRIVVTIHSIGEIKPQHVYVCVYSQWITIQVSESIKHATGDEFIIHSAGPLKLYSQVQTQGSSLKVSGRRLVITLRKRTACHWRQMTKQKLGWIKVDHDRLYSSDSDDSQPGSRAEAGFMGRFLSLEDPGSAHAPRYNALTGEQVLPEYMFSSSDNQIGSEDQDLDFLHDAAVEHNNDLLA